MSGEFSREALRARLGDEVFDQTVRLAAEAPAPSEQQLERVRQIFGPHVRRRAAAERSARSPRAA